jgi:hypothetical protein
MPYSAINAKSRPLFQLVQMLQPRKNHLLAGLLDLARKKHLVQDRIDLIRSPASAASTHARRGAKANLVEIEHQVQLAHVAEELVQNLHEEVYRLEVR